MAFWMMRLNHWREGLSLAGKQENERRTGYH
jgi:hypothetical protein